MKTLIVGSGNIGSVAAEDMAKNNSSLEVTVADKDEKRARIVTERIGRANVSSLNLDTSNRAKLVTTLREFDLVMGFCLETWAMPSWKRALKRKETWSMCPSWVRIL